MTNVSDRYNKLRLNLTVILYRKRIEFDRWRKRHGMKLFTIILLTAVLVSILMMPYLQHVVGDFFTSDERLATLRTLLGGTGTALIGAAAIAFSIVVFAMQINVERMPHGLFRRLSSDRRLLGSFLGSFATALAVTATSLIPDSGWAAAGITAAVWGIAVIVLFFLYAYRRALQLINPIEQLTLMSLEVQQDLRRWEKLATTVTALVDMNVARDSVEHRAENKFDAAKSEFFRVNAHWTKPALRAINYAVSYAKRFAEQGDYEVTDYAFQRVMLINATYCAAKNGTFVGNNLLFEVSGATDGFINASLEQLRQTMQAALTKGDERLAESTLRAIAGLYGVYLEIDYPQRGGSKYHALLAAGYMGSAVESVVPHNMPDLMMEGIRLMGRSSRVAIERTVPTDITSTADKIATLSQVGVIRANHQPVTLTGFEQLADITFELLLNGKGDISFAIRRLRAAVTGMALSFMETLDTPLGSQHRNTLGPYFSSTSFSSLRSRLASIVNQLAETPRENSRAREIIDNIENWADQIYVTQKEMLLLAVQKRSSVTFDVISWAVGTPEMLNALSNAPACTPQAKEDLRKHAIWLVSTLSWIPDDLESVNFAENHRVTESIFEAALDGDQRGCDEFYETCKKLLMGWAKKGGGHNSGWGILERAASGLIALAIRDGTTTSADALKIQFREMLVAEGGPSPELRSSAAADLARSADEFRYSEPAYSRIDSELARLDQGAVRTLMHEIAEILRPIPN
ncbi:hypothetical protein [Luteimonas fraxinea]|uniref:hypothetical protein n=1 Tax=Luteimonas fraxinea TaxID=2901869 RepID=UPI001E428AEA|nr:hypothetical protein [Luteimonas fraxinea]MCD9125774.1 hypothetical protein [Luteimonas fraxinea]